MHILLNNNFFRLSGLLHVGAYLLLALSGQAAAQTAQEVNIYSYREPQLIRPLLDVFREKTGIRVNVINAESGLIERLRVEGERSPADLLLTTDISSLTDIKAAGLTQPVTATSLVEKIPSHLRDPQGHWFGVTKRARVVVTAKDRVAHDAVRSYIDLADLRWQGRICTRSGKHKYMRALFAAQVEHQGASDAKNWLTGLKNNLARKPQGNDRAQIRAVAAGECDLALVNNYYLFVMLNDPRQRPYAERVRVVFPDQQGHGTHMNISGMALARHAPNRSAALQLMEFLVSPQGQQIYTELVGEYPVLQNAPYSELLQSWGRFKEDKLSLSRIAANRGAALRLVNEIGYDE